jgi:malonyl CoA-acyl carrier protein transacylase
MLAFVFPGQGAQKVGMGKEIHDKFQIARDVFKKADDALGFSISKLCFEGPEDELKLTANAQPAILTTSVAVLTVIKEVTGLVPKVVAGHSLGEYSALVCAGSLSFEDAVVLVNKRGKYMQEAVPAGEGSMAAVMGVSSDEVEKLCKDAAEGKVLTPANFNSAQQIVISGHEDAIDRAVKLGNDRGAVVMKLKVSAPFHSTLMEPAAVNMAKEFESIDIKSPIVPVVSNVEAEPNLDGSKVADLLTRQITAPVQWEKSVRKMVEMGVQEFLEIGCGKTLTSLIRRIEKGIKAGNIEEPSHIEALKKSAADDLKEHVQEEEFNSDDWVACDDGSRIRKDGGKIIWADGKDEEVTEEHWHFNENGSKIRKYGEMKIIWADGKLEVLSPGVWRWRKDGSFVKNDFSRIIKFNGEVEDFNLDEWEITEHRTMKKKDGLRIIWDDGLEWDFNDPHAHGF